MKNPTRSILFFALGALSIGIGSARMVPTMRRCPSQMKSGEFLALRHQIQAFVAKPAAVRAITLQEGTAWTMRGWAPKKVTFKDAKAIRLSLNSIAALNMPFLHSSAGNKEGQPANEIEVTVWPTKGAPVRLSLMKVQVPNLVALARGQRMRAPMQAID